MFWGCLLSVGVDASRRMTDLLPRVLRLRYKDDNSGKFPSWEAEKKPFLPHPPLMYPVKDHEKLGRAAIKKAPNPSPLEI
jgi:hypothetical protein